MRTWGSDGGIQGPAPPPARPKALVTGANGFSGTHMVELLLARGYEVVASDVGETPSPVFAGRVAYERCDLRDDVQTIALVTGHAPFDVVFHIAGLLDHSAPYEALYNVNVMGTWNLLDAMRYTAYQPKRVVIWGSAGIYDYAAESPAKEHSPVRPKSAYAQTKYAAERLARVLGLRQHLPITVIRPGGIYGPRSTFGIALQIFMTARGGVGPFYFGSTTNRMSTVHVADVCDAAEFLWRRPEAAGETYNVDDGAPHAVATLSRAIARRLDFPLWPGAFPTAITHVFMRRLARSAAARGRLPKITEDMTEILDHDMALDVSKLFGLGWRPAHPDPVKGLIATIDWYEKEGWL